MRPGADSAWLWTGAGCNNGCADCPIRATNPPEGVTPEAVAGMLPRPGHQPSGRMGTDSLAVLAGGEPFVRRDIWRLVAAIRSVGYRPGLITNGRALCYPQVRRQLRESNLAYLRVQLFGLDSTHDARVSVPGAIAQSLEGLSAWVDENGTDADLDVGLPLDASTLSEAPRFVAALAERFPSPDIQFRVSLTGELPDATVLDRAMQALRGFDRQGFRPLLAWEGFPQCIADYPAHLPVARPAPNFACGSSPGATCLGPVRHDRRYSHRHCPPCVHRPYCNGLLPGIEPPREDGVPRDTSPWSATAGPAREPSLPSKPYDTDRWAHGWIARLRGRVLDVGSHAPSHRDALIARARAGEIEYQRIDAPTRAAPSGDPRPDGRFHIASIEDVALRDGYFDHVLFLDSIDAVVDLPAAFGRIAALLRPEGTLLIGDRAPDAAHPARLASWDLLPLLRLLRLRTLFHRQATVQTAGRWLLHQLRVP